TWDFLGRLPASRRLECEGRIIELHHGSPASDIEYVTAYKPMPPSIEQFWDQSDARVLLLGHTHIPMIERGARGTVINPGPILGFPASRLPTPSPCSMSPASPCGSSKYV